MNMVVAGLLVAVVMYIAKFFDWVGQIGVRPIWICPLVGLVLGDLTQGVVLGATLEMVFIGAISIGGSVPQDYVSGGILGCAFAILLGESADVAVTLAVPLSLAFTLIFQAETIIWTAAVPLFDRYIDERDFKKYSALHYAISFVHPLLYAIVTFVAVAFGTDGISAFINAMPAWVMSGFSIAAGLLPAIGFAMLLKMLWDKSILAFFFIGFFATLYITRFMNTFYDSIAGLAGDAAPAAFAASSLTMPMAIIGVCIAALYYFIDSKQRAQVKRLENMGAKRSASTDSTSVKEEFFND